MLPEQQAYFETFGFILLRQQFSTEEMNLISIEFDDAMLKDRQGRPYAGERQHLEPFLEKETSLDRLVEDDRIYGPVEQLLGPGFVWDGSDANRYVGDTQWHADKGGDAVKLGYDQIKVILYLDTVKKDSGCLRVIPGSQRAPYHHFMEPLADRNGNSDMSTFGVSGSEIPCYAIESEPGDVIFFHQSTFHSSFGGSAGRRMFTLVFGAYPTLDEEVEYLRGFKQAYRPPLRFVNSSSPRIKGTVSRLLELGFEIIDPQ